MGAAGLDDIHPFIGLGLDRGGQCLGMRQQMLLQFHHRGDVHRGRERVVGRLAHIDVVVRVHRLFAADLAAEQLDRAVRQDLVDVHVGLRARAGLPDIERKMLVELAGDRLVGGTHDGVRLPLRQPAGRGIDQCRRLLDIAVGVIDALWHPVVADREMDEAALRLRPPIAVGRHLDLAHRVGLAPHSGRAMPIGVSCGSGWVWSFMSLLLRRHRAPLNAASPADRYDATDHVPASPTRRVGYRAALARAACAASGTSRRANRPSMKKPRPKRKPIRFPTVLCLPRETSEPKSRYV